MRLDGVSPGNGGGHGHGHGKGQGHGQVQRNSNNSNVFRRMSAVLVLAVMGLTFRDFARLNYVITDISVDRRAAQQQQQRQRQQQQQDAADDGDGRRRPERRGVGDPPPPEKELQQQQQHRLHDGGAQALLLQDALKLAPVGSLGPQGAGARSHLLYYDYLFLLCLKYGHNAQSVLEVGCSSDPFIQHLTWIDADRRSCLAPYFASYQGSGGKKNTTTRATTGNGSLGIRQIKADFMKWTLPNSSSLSPGGNSSRNSSNIGSDVDHDEHDESHYNGSSYDLVLCNQVLEHVPDPGAFLKKLLATGVGPTTIIISVPYRWRPCNKKKCGHLHHGITLDTIKTWAATGTNKGKGKGNNKGNKGNVATLVHTAVITESEGNREQRLFAVFQRNAGVGVDDAAEEDSR